MSLGAFVTSRETAITFDAPLLALLTVCDEPCEFDTGEQDWNREP